MNRTLITLAEKAAQTEALLKAIEMVLGGIEIDRKFIPQADRAENLVYIAEELMTQFQEDITKLQIDERIVDVFRAAHDLRIEKNDRK